LEGADHVLGIATIQAVRAERSPGNGIKQRGSIIGNLRTREAKHSGVVPYFMLDATRRNANWNESRCRLDRFDDCRSGLIVWRQNCAIEIY
jgi:hypothetical protein